MRSFSAAVLAACGLASTAAAALTNPVDPIMIKGSKFYYTSNETQFFMRGVAYQESYSGGPNSGSDETDTNYVDPLANSSACQRDVPYLAGLQTNIIRVYTIDPTADHDECMQLLNNAGIYVIADLADPYNSIQSDDAQWNTDIYSRYTSVIDTMAGYENMLGFFAGNEVAYTPNTTYAADFVRAAIRDMKSYISAKNYRSSLGIGYASNDNQYIRYQLADYMNCGDQASAVDFWGYNIYEWCGDATYADSGYQARTEEFSGYSVPAFFAEYGCNDPTPRKWTEVQAIYGDQMTPVWSGAIAYQYFQNANDYGLVSVDGNSVSTLADYTNLQSQLASITPSGTSKDSYSPTNSPASCPTTNVSFMAVASPLPPTPNLQLCDCMEQTLQCNISSSVSAEDYGAIFAELCGYPGHPCAGINTNITEGAYGAFGMCNAVQQLGYALNAYYKSQGKSAGACSFGGSATVQSSSAATGSCSALLAQAGTTGTVSGSVPTGSSGSGSGSGSGSSSGSKGLGSPLGVHHVSFGGVMTMGLYMVIAIGSGFAMLLL